MQKRSVWVGYDPRFHSAYDVTVASIRKHSDLSVEPVALGDLGDLYRRPTENLGGQLWDTISDAPMSTEFAISRFLVPHLAGSGWALFLDCDMLARTDLNALFDLADPKYAVMCVKHNHQVQDGDRKAIDQAQVPYARKNWSSVMMFNCDHPSNRALTVELINTVPGRDLHRFCWLKDEEIGELSLEWNWLANVSPPLATPKIVHFTEGTPDMPGYENSPYADEWRELENI